MWAISSSAGPTMSGSTSSAYVSKANPMMEMMIISHWPAVSLGAASVGVGWLMEGSSDGFSGSMKFYQFCRGRLHECSGQSSGNNESGGKAFHGLDDLRLRRSALVGHVRCGAAQGAGAAWQSSEGPALRGGRVLFDCGSGAGGRAIGAGRTVGFQFSGHRMGDARRRTGRARGGVYYLFVSQWRVAELRDASGVRRR